MKQLPEDIIETNDKIADAKELLRENDGTANQVWESIRYFAEDMGLKEKEEQCRG